MSTYPDRYQLHDFTTHVSITHTPTGFKFVQQGGRITILGQDYESGRWLTFTDFTNNDLQIEHTVLTEAALRRAAIVWLKDNLK